MQPTETTQMARRSGAALPSPRHAPLGFAAFVGLIAGLMGLNALATDVMLPAFPLISGSFALQDPNEVQTVVSAYLLGFGGGQLVMGVLSDRYGRRPVLLTGLAVYFAAALWCVVAPNMTTMLIARVIQGAGSAAPRVIATAAIRDCYEGRRMARVVSLVMMVFMAVPVLAPTLGQAVLFVADWRAVFGLLAVYSFVMFALCAAFLPETLRPEHRRAIRPYVILAALRSLFGSRQTVGYMLAAGVFFGAMFGFINSAQQVLVDVMGLGVWFPAVFAVGAAGIAVSAFVNARLVERLGMRLLSHTAVFLYLGISLLMAGFAELGLLDAWVFVPLLSASMLLVGLVFSNFNALAMEPQGHIAGIASSVIGATTVLVGGLIGYAIGQSFDGTATPMALGFAGSGAATVVILLVTERGRLFRSGRTEPGTAHR
ncbi:MAG: multidrug effflux MFS transporter [Alphaproteobacteria bacterium]|nr:multidrug effflux MFS transporter [Alphaproteobacteria bacterium]MDX5370005.1 multidrug effflux MFS transporter [Alphaproteobacteria bacterium]MDX5464583.1 multidrug effflux MFS transporter [Alphaproteobacteria bacterium]